MTPKPDALKTIPLFSGLAPKELELLSHHLTVKEYLAAQTIFDLGDAAAQAATAQR